MAKIYLGLGSNLKNRKENILKAISFLRAQKIFPLKFSSLYETEPVGLKNQPKFLNCVLCARTKLGPRELLNRLKAIERLLRRVPNKKNGPRTIDLDILFYDDLILNNKNLTIPHPRLHKRAFVLVPLQEIAPDLFHPVLKKRVTDLLVRLKGKGLEGIRRYSGDEVYRN